MTIRRPLWASQRGQAGDGGAAGEVVITETQEVPSITATLGYVGESDDPVVTLDITDPATDAEELRVYRSASAIDAAALPSPLTTLSAATVAEDDAAVAIGTTYHYRVGSVTGGLVRLSAGVSVEVVEKPAGPDFSTAAIGDEIGGGIYAGINTESDGTEYHIVFAMQEGELAPSAESRWKVGRTSTPGTDSNTDGWANTSAMEAAGLTDHPAALYCRNYTGGGKTDWYLPARTELALEANIRGHAEMSVDPDVWRWTSTEYSAELAWIRRFSDGTENTSGGFKDYTLRRVRPVRRVAV